MTSFDTPIAGKDYKLKLPKEHLSFSQIDSYLRCPAKYRDEVILGERVGTSVAMWEGSVMAECMEHVCKLKMKRPKATPKISDVVVHYQKLIKDRVTKERNRKGRVVKRKLPIVWGMEDLQGVRDRGLGFLEEFWKQGHIKRIKPVGTEVMIKKIYAGVPFIGYVDLEEEDRVDDFKVVSSSRFYDPEKSLQLQFYADIMRKPKVGYYLFLKKSGMIDTPSARVQPDRLTPYLTHIVATVAKGISEGVFPPHPPHVNGLCDPRWCDSWDHCVGASR